jgi:pyridinium-3,5-biscarboxylic acid mononucleotide sulfurtransferase
MASMDDLERKRVALRRELEATGGLMVAFSGGVDSGLLLAAAAEALGPRAVAATGVSPSLAERELADARAFAAELGVRHLVVPTHEQDRPGYLANGPDRCYFCKAELFEVLAPLAEAEGLALAVGTNADDLGDWRPGQRAAAERDVRTPLVAAGFTKRDVREASRRMGLRTHDKPAAACLASRVAYGIQVTPARLSRVERAEALVRSLFTGAPPRGSPGPSGGLAQLRVRDHGDLARVEVPVDALPVLVGSDARQRLVEGLRELGFTYVTLDLEGFRSGSMNARVAP